ncbi:hypothetical protein [Candidatus Villigracilis saccharophilus]|uniref:hypothetical protein n=1 Tax=Candidatus Villigracilis saccharophilus TaxID=3140684 RepID=UPI0031353379|nr:hypothetical protein [Anaerolineales bacterium]
MEITSTQPSVQNQFMEVFKFDYQDLLSNKTATSVKPKKKRVMNYAVTSFSIFQVVGLFFTGMFLFVSKKPFSEISLAIPGFFLVIFTIIGASLAWLHWSTYSLGTVKRLYGKVEFQEVKGMLFLCIEETRIRMLLDVVNLFEKNSVYAIYYADPISTIMSVEKVS